jgi:hypothetical protein
MLKSFALLFITCAFLFSCGSQKQDSVGHLSDYHPVHKQLFDTILRQDHLLFDAFHQRNIEVFRKYFTEDLEIYQDNVGLRNYAEAMEAFAELFKKEYVLKRMLIPGTVEVYPIQGFGAIQTGWHSFSHTEEGKMVCDTFKFMHIWKEEQKQWKVSRIVTYDH